MGAAATPEGSWSVDVRRDSDWIYYLDAEATITEGGLARAGASRRLGMVVKLRTPDLMPRAALTTQGTTRYGGASSVHGQDNPPDGSSKGRADWTGVCPTTGLTDVPGILIDDVNNIRWNGNQKKIEKNMSGSPKYAGDPTITAASLLDFGSMNWNDLVSMATVSADAKPKPGPALTPGGACDTSDHTNWGDPVDFASPCSDYFPIIYHNGDMHLSGGMGQGILLVEGNLKVVGGAEFYGPVVVRGELSTMGSGGHFWGGVIAANVDLSDNTILGNAVIQYSSCAVERAVLNSSLTRVQPLAERAWVDLSNAANH